MTATLCSTSSPTPPSQTRKSCPPPYPVAASPSSTSIRTLTHAKCTSRHSLECLVSICGSISVFLFCATGRVCDCVCAHVRMHNWHLKRCFTSASFHPPCDCKKSSLKRQVVYFPHSSMTAKLVKGTSLILTPHNLER